ncbi:MAG: filamentous hemagglutinin N-terminal domain-containing protein [Smithella sp.]
MKNRIQRYDAIAIFAITMVVFLSFSGTSSALESGALPTGGKIVSGKGEISTTGSQMTVKQSNHKMITNWDTFNIGEQAGVTFKQPNANSVALNRVIGLDPSQIYGKLSADGQVWVINPNGLLIGQNAKINVGGLVASTLNMSDSNFLAGSYVFTNNGSAGSVRNQGNISIIPGGVVALIGPSVTNEGTITANRGSVILGAGNQVTLDFKGDGLLSYTIDKGAVDALVANKGLIKADGGLVVLTAKAADSLTRAVVNNSGIIEAQTLKNKEGSIMLLSDSDYGQTIVDGTLDASAPNGGKGGFIETSGANVKINDTAKVTTAAPKGKTGTWLIDPYDFTIAPSGGDVTGATLTTALASASVTIRTTAINATCTGVSCGSGNSAGNGDIFVNDNFTWTQNTLTLNAYRNIVINRELFGSGTAVLALLYGQNTNGITGTYTINAPINLPAGNNFSTKNGPYTAAVSYYVITSLGAQGSATGTDLQGMRGNLTRNYALGGNIDASPTSTWNSNAGFLPVGTDANDFMGNFEGLGHMISNLTINRPAMDYVGLFGVTNKNNSGTTVRDFGIVGGSITGREYVGALAGQEGNRTSDTMISVYSTASVTGTNYVGGLVGWGYGTIVNAYATGNVSGTTNVGGLVGVHKNGEIINTYATGLVSGSGSYIGGLVGRSTGSSTITNSYWDTATTGQATSSGGGTGRTTAQMMQTANFSGWDFTNTWWLSAGNTRPFLRMEYSNNIVNAHQLQLMAMYPTASYTLGANINMSELTNASGLWNTTTKFVSIGDGITPFTGTFNGQNYTITNLDINRPSTDYVGLFGTLGSGSSVSNVGLVNGSVTGNNFVGHLVGLNLGTITKAYTTGSVTGNAEVGGLVGFNIGTITRSYATGNVSGNNDVGGLAGGNFGSIENTYAWGNVTGAPSAYCVGGLVGYIAGPGTVSYSYATGAVIGGAQKIGGLAGKSRNILGTTNSFWDTETTGQGVSSGGTGKTTADLMNPTTFTDAGWDTTNIWTVASYPTLK